MATIAKITGGTFNFPSNLGSTTVTWNKNDADHVELDPYIGNRGTGAVVFGPNVYNLTGNSYTLTANINADELWANTPGKDYNNWNKFLLWSYNSQGNTFNDSVTGWADDAATAVIYPTISISASTANSLIEDTVNYVLNKSTAYSSYKIFVEVYGSPNSYLTLNDRWRALYNVGAYNTYTPPILSKTITSSTNSDGSFTFSTSELQTIYNGLSGKQSAYVYIRMRPLYNNNLPVSKTSYTDSNGNHSPLSWEGSGDDVETNKLLTLTLTNNVPAFTTYNYADTNTATTSVTGNNQYLVQNKSHLVVTIPVANKATVNSSGSMSYYKVTFNGVTQTANWSSTADVSIDMGYPSASGNNTLTVSAYDTYGLHQDVSKTVTCLSYADTTLFCTASRQDGYGDTTTIAINGAYSPLTISSTKKNALNTLSYRYISYDDDTPTWTSSVNLLTSTTQNTDGTYSVTSFTLTLDKTKTYTIEFTVHDKLGNPTAVINKTVSIGIPIFFIDAGKMSLGFNSIPSQTKVLDMGNNNIASVKEIWGAYGLIARSYDEWLRINEDGSHTNGVYFGNNIVRTDGVFQVGSNGSKVYLKNDGTVLASNYLFNPDGSQDTGLVWLSDGNFDIRSNAKWRIGVHTDRLDLGGDDTAISNIGIKKMLRMYSTDIQDSNGNWRIGVHPDTLMLGNGVPIQSTSIKIYGGNTQAPKAILFSNTNGDDGTGNYNKLSGGEGDVGNLSDKSDMNIDTWFGFTICPSISGQHVAQWNPAFNMDARQGDLHVNRDGRFDGGWVYSQNFYNTSLVELKQDITPTSPTEGLDLINAMDVYKFRFKEDVKQNRATYVYGAIIGDGYKTPEELMSYDHKAMNLYSSAYANIKATQELYQKVLDLTDRVDQLESDNADLVIKNAILEEKVNS